MLPVVLTQRFEAGIALWSSCGAERPCPVTGAWFGTRRRAASPYLGCRASLRESETPHPPRSLRTARRQSTRTRWLLSLVGHPAPEEPRRGPPDNLRRPR